LSNLCCQKWNEWTFLYGEYKKTNCKDRGTTGDNTTENGRPSRPKTERKKGAKAVRERQEEEDRRLPERQEEEKNRRLKKRQEDQKAL